MRSSESYVRALGEFFYGCVEDNMNLSYSDLFRVSMDPRVEPEGNRKESVPEGDRKESVPEGDRKESVPEGDERGRKSEG